MMIKLCFVKVRFGAIVNAWIGSRYLLVLSLYFLLLDYVAFGASWAWFTSVWVFLYTRVPPFVDGGV